MYSPTLSTSGNVPCSVLYSRINKMANDGNETVSDIYRASQTKLFIGEVPKDNEEEHGEQESPIKQHSLHSLTTPMESEAVFPPDKKE